MPKSFWDDSSRPIAIAHRGGDAAGASKENTLEAFQTASELGYRYAETDVILAASGEIVLFHGSHNWLQAGFTRSITRSVLQKMTLDQIRYALKPGGAQVSTLEEVLASFPKMKFILDLKTDEAAIPLAKLIKKLKAEERACITGFGYKRLKVFSEACRPKTLSTGLTVGRGLRFRNMNMLMLKTGRLSGVEAIFMHHSLVSTPMVNLIHHRGLKAVVWTANSKLGIKHAVRSGADGVISDRIGLLKEVLESRK
jgi:glycerophosphoryl diester phosphodiesterase